jgi:hypothetical protein
MQAIINIKKVFKGIGSLREREDFYLKIIPFPQQFSIISKS